MNWRIREEGFSRNNIEFFGSKFCIGNGYFGYRGTLEEYGKEQLAACTLSEIFDDNGSGWREPVNLPNGLYTYVECNGKKLSVLDTDVEDHYQELDMERALHRRRTVFLTEDGKRVTVEAERFASVEDIHLLAMRFRVTAEENADVQIITAIDRGVWDINGPHFEQVIPVEGAVSGLILKTGEEKRMAAVGQTVNVTRGEGNVSVHDTQIRVHAVLGQGETLEIEKYVAICKDTDCKDIWNEAVLCCQRAAKTDFIQLLERQREIWRKRYESVGIQIKGDEEAQQAIYYSCYLLFISAPFHTDRVAVPARGLSGQVYKGGMFWDTEIYMLMMFAFCVPSVARNLVMYRIRNLEGARNKAAEYGYRGAFYPWESQENGKDGCTHYNLTDIFTGRKMRTYFRDKQIHISADVVYGIWKYITITKDYQILLEGGAEVILECARFFCSYAYFKKDKDRYEFLDVTGADEYHERVNNDAYTNYMIHLTMRTAMEVLSYLEQRFHPQYVELMDHLDYWQEYENVKEIYEKIYLPSPDRDGVIWQFDGYRKEEDLSIEELYSRIIRPNEYLGSPCGLAVNTQIIKQADVVLLLSLLGEQFQDEVKETNWAYYEPRTEHGSSLSTCIYALLAAQIGKTDWAYKFLMKAARIDLDGDYKLYLGDLYIGGTHPAANGGTWMVAVQGFGGLTPLKDRVRITPHLPEKWEEFGYQFCYGGGSYHVEIGQGTVRVTSADDNTQNLTVENAEKAYTCRPGTTISFTY